MHRNLVAENWRLEKSRYAMVGNHCEGCKKYYFPEKEVCLGCGESKLREHIFTGYGKLVEWTKIHEVATGFELFSPIYYAIIELDEGVRISTQLTSVDDETKLEPGIRTRMVFRKLFEDGDQGVVTYGFKAKPIYE